MMKRRTLHIGIAPYDVVKARTRAIVRGTLVPGPNAPKMWFTSIESVAQVLSRRNRTLLALIARAKPTTVSDLARLSGRAKSNLSRTLKTLEQYGLVRLERDPRGRVRPSVPFGRIRFEIDLGAAG